MAVFSFLSRSTVSYCEMMLDVGASYKKIHLSIDTVIMYNNRYQRRPDRQDESNQRHYCSEMAGDLCYQSRH